MDLTAQSKIIPLLVDAASAPTTGEAAWPDAFNKVIFAKVTHNTTGAVNATIEIYGGTNKTDGILLATITLSGTNSAFDGFSFDAPWPYVWAKLTAISATSKVNVDLGC